MTIKDYIRTRGLEEYTASAGDNLKIIASIIYQSYTPRVWDLLVAINNLDNKWHAFSEDTQDGIKPGDIIYYVSDYDLDMITEVL